MAIPPPQSGRAQNKDLKPPFVDSSNRRTTKHHAHLRTSSASSLRKSPPTCTVSLASVTSGPAPSIPIAFPSSVCVPFPSDDGDLQPGSCGDGSAIPFPEPWRRPRARTSHVETPRRAQPPPKPARRISKHPSTSPNVNQNTRTRAPCHPPSLANLRLAALVERSIVQFSVGSVSSSEATLQLHVQDALLVSRLRALLALHGRRVRPSSPTTGISVRITIAPPACAPSVLLSGSTGVIFEPALGQPGSPFPSTPTLRFIPTRARSSSRGSINSSATLNMPALVATLLLRRHEGGRPSSAGTFTLRRDIKRSLPSPSPLGVHIFSSSG
ncbi:hypothetical protein B0H19DRAFT_715405 [Mycena capillaripes]|nr:hypothetical protein B0H19DRAFT_715405 [Mycena capillaripes]